MQHYLRKGVIMLYLRKGVYNAKHHGCVYSSLSCLLQQLLGGSTAHYAARTRPHGLRPSHGGPLKTSVASSQSSSLVCHLSNNGVLEFKLGCSKWAHILSTGSESASNGAPGGGSDSPPSHSNKVSSSALLRSSRLL